MVRPQTLSVMVRNSKLAETNDIPINIKATQKDKTKKYLITATTTMLVNYN